jgi:ELWxxDGT repeat protein
LFEFDPATDSTRLIQDIGNGFSSMPIKLTQYGSRLFFTAQDMSYGRQIWYYDGTTTAMYANLNSSISAHDFTVWDNRLFMSMDVNDGAFGTELYCLRDPTNISDVTTEAFTVYPNPFQDGFQLKLISDKHAASYHLKICNIVGSLVCEKILDGNRVNATWISLGEYPPGLYVISVANSIGKCCFQKTLIKQ